MFHFARIKKIFHQGTTQIFFGTKELLHFARTVVGTKELLSFFEIKELLYFCWICVWNQGTTLFFFFFKLESKISFGIKDLLNFARIKDHLNFVGIKDLPGFTL